MVEQRLEIRGTIFDWDYFFQSLLKLPIKSLSLKNLVLWMITRNIQSWVAEVSENGLSTQPSPEIQFPCCNQVSCRDSDHGDLTA